MKNLLLLSALFSLLTLRLDAKYIQTCQAKYMTEDGWSKKYTVEITFISGTELNDATSSYKYSSYSVYAVIFWGEGQASVIKLSGYFSCSTEVTKSCITNTYTDHKGTDQNETEWKICVSDYCY
jgi:hypothetical protein